MGVTSGSDLCSNADMRRMSETVSDRWGLLTNMGVSQDGSRNQHVKYTESTNVNTWWRLILQHTLSIKP